MKTTLKDIFILPSGNSNLTFSKIIDFSSRFVKILFNYYGHYSNASRGLRQKKNLDDLIPSILEPEDLKPNCTWLRLIQKIYEVDPLTYPKCQGQMRIPAFIEAEEVIEKILKHLGLWDLKVRPPPKVKVPSIMICIDYSDSQVPFSAPSFYPDPITRWIPM